MLFSRLRPVVALAALWSAGCAAPAAPAVAVGQPPPPVPPPITTVTGCVESRELHAYVLALDRQRALARAQAVAALGAHVEERHGRWDEPGAAALDGVVDDGAQRWAVVAQRVSDAEPVATLARVGQVLRRIDERPRAHPSAVLSCSEQRCAAALPAAPTSPARPGVRSLSIELAPGESLGPALELAYDYWWADVRYERSARCAGQPAGGGAK